MIWNIELEIGRAALVHAAHGTSFCLLNQPQKTSNKTDFERRAAQHTFTNCQVSQKHGRNSKANLWTRVQRIIFSPTGYMHRTAFPHIPTNRTS